MKRLLCLVAVIAMALSMRLPFVLAADPFTDVYKIYMGETKIIPVSNPTKIVIGNPAIIDVTNVTRTEMTLSPKAAGKTILVFYDNYGEQSYQIRVLSEDMSDTKASVDSMLASIKAIDVRTEIQEDDSKVLLLGSVETTEEKDRIVTALKSLKEKIVDLIEVKEEGSVVEIDVQVLELNKDASKELGFTWPGSITLNELGSPGVPGDTMDVEGTLDGETRGTKWSTLFKVLNLARSNFTWKLDALVQEGKATVLSRPRLACQSGKEAELMVGGEKPIFTTVVSESGQGTEVKYKEYGIKLKIKPTVTEEGKIKVALKVEVSEVEAAETIGDPEAPSAKAYPLIKRTASTELFMNNGQTLAMGGLIKQKDEEDSRKIAGLGDIPILGAAFRRKSFKSGGGQGERGNSELFIVLTPTIVSKGGDKEKIVHPVLKDAALIDSSSYFSGPSGNYAKLVQQRILNSMSYPSLGRQAGYEGTVKLSLHLSYTGKLIDVAVKESSGYTVLDDHAVSEAKRLSAYPPFPPSITEKEIWVDVPVLYHLD